MKPHVKLFAVIASLLTGISPLQAQNLSETYELALQNAPILKQALAKQSAIGESKDQSTARFLPNISATAASSKQLLHNKKTNTFQGTAVNQDFWDNTFNLNLTQPLFHWDHWIQLSQSDNQIAQAEATYLAELQNLMVKTTEAYFNVLYAQDNLQFASAEKQAIARQLEQAQHMFAVGIIAITDINERKRCLAQCTGRKAPSTQA